MLDPITKLRITSLEQRRLLKKAERTSEARRFAHMKHRGAFPYDAWLARLGGNLISIGMKLKARADERYSESGLNAA